MGFNKSSETSQIWPEPGQEQELETKPDSEFEFETEQTFFCSKIETQSESKLINTAPNLTSSHILGIKPKPSYLKHKLRKRSSTGCIFDIAPLNLTTSHANRSMNNLTTQVQLKNQSNERRPETHRPQLATHQLGFLNRKFNDSLDFDTMINQGFPTCRSPLLTLKFSLTPLVAKDHRV